MVGRGCGGGVQLAPRKFGLGGEGGQPHGAGELHSGPRRHVSLPPYPILQKIPWNVLSECFWIPHLSDNLHLHRLRPSPGHLSPGTTGASSLVPLARSHPPALHPSSAARAIHTAPVACKVLQHLASVTSLKTVLPLLLSQALSGTLPCLLVAEYIKGFCTWNALPLETRPPPKTPSLPLIRSLLQRHCLGEAFPLPPRLEQNPPPHPKHIHTRFPHPNFLRPHATLCYRFIHFVVCFPLECECHDSRDFSWHSRWSINR